jgi:putative aldouronate transport system substrate-binding protein
MKKNRLFPWMMALVLGLTILAPVTTAAAEEPIQLVCYTQLANYSGKTTGWFAKELLDRFNVELTIVPDADGVYETRIESGNLGDIVIWGNNGRNYLNACTGGYLFDWEEDNLLYDYAPYVAEHMQPALEQNRNISGTGKIYGIGNSIATSTKDHESFFYTWDIRWDLYKQLGYPQINTMDDLFNLFVAMKEISPVDENGNETYAFSLWPDWDGNMVMYVKAFMSAWYGYDEFFFGYLNCENGEYISALDPDGPYIESIRFFNKMYRAGLIDPNSMTATYDTMSEKLGASGIFCSIFNFSGSSGYNTDKHMADGKIMLSMVPGDASPIVAGMSTLGGPRIWSIGAKSEYPELCLEIINWMSTPTGYLTASYGPQDVCWYYGDDGLTYLTELGKACQKDPDTELSDPKWDEYTHGEWDGKFVDGTSQMNNSTWSYDATNPDNGERYNKEYWASYQTTAEYAIDQDWRDWAGVQNVQAYMANQHFVVKPATPYTDATMDDDLNLIWTQVRKAIVDGTWNLVYAKNDGEFNYLLNQMIKNADGYGYERCAEFARNEAARWWSMVQVIQSGE